MTKDNKIQEKTEKARPKYLDAYQKLVGKAFDKHYIEDPDNISVERISTGSIALDAYLKGGYPKGKIVEFYGPNQSGKTTACIEGAEEFQKKYPDEQILWLDLEDAFDAKYCKKIGLDTSKNFTLIRPHSGEQAYELMKLFCQNEEGGLIVLDSVALLLPETEDEGEMGKAAMGSQARLNSQGLRKLFPHSRSSNTTCFFINQTRDKLGVMFGSPTTTSGGNALAFYARTRLEFSKSNGEKDADDNFISNRTGIKTIKANYGHPNQKLELYIKYGEGFDTLKEIVDVAEELGIIQKSGSWYSYEGTKLGQGSDNVKKLLADNEELLQKIEEQIREKLVFKD